MTIYIDGHAFHYEVRAVCMLFLTGPLRLVQGAPPPGEEAYVYTGLGQGEGEARLTVRVSFRGSRLCAEERVARGPGEGERCERAFGRMLYTLLGRATGRKPPWGILTGVRPVKLVQRQLLAGADEGALSRRFCGELLVSPGRLALAEEVARVQRPLLAGGARDFALYVSIPFCPSRCRYCSFVSHSIAKAGELVAPYLRLLEEELREQGERAARLGLRLRSIYFGGGTPTTLTAPQLADLFEVIAAGFDLSALEEYTVEAGRPDTITPEKLGCMRAAGVNRISINPQSLQDAVLIKAGRPHTAAQTLAAFGLARQAGFATINMDLIAGLSGDTPAGFADTLGRVVALGPENITVHTLCLKRSAGLNQEGGAAALPRRGHAGEMVASSLALLPRAGYRPYYLYRQKNMADNLENTGWSLPGHESLYNVRIMDESLTILAAGAGGVTKLVRTAGACGADGVSAGAGASDRAGVPGGAAGQPGGAAAEISRIFNYKYPYEYISRYQQLRGRWKKIDQFFTEGGNSQALP